MLAWLPLHAQDAAATDQTEQDAGAAEAALEEVIVTGSRVIRNGFESPTPTTMLTVEEIQNAAPVNVADYINTMPQMLADRTPRSPVNAATSAPVSGLNLLNMRGLGFNRNLVLLDGQRVAPTLVEGGVDVNTLPLSLVKRIDIVTGGASAAYGSDAITGVVNFVLDREYTGLKADASFGQTSRGDDANRNLDIAAGSEFAGGRGHLLGSVSYSYNEGIPDWYTHDRPWFQPCNIITQSTQPRRITRCDTHLIGIAQGGVITSTALANIQFGEGGFPMPFEVGSPHDNTFMVGGNEWYESGAVSPDAKVERTSFWGRVSYEFTPAATGALQLSTTQSNSLVMAGWQRYPGYPSGLKMFVENPFLDPGIAAQAEALGITQFNYGYSTYDLGRPSTDADRQNLRLVASLEGSFNAMDTSWNWDAYYQYGEVTSDFTLHNTTDKARFAAAIDAVRDPATGAIVCRSTLANPGNGCVPLNIFGIGVASAAGIDYVKGEAWQHLKFKQDVVAVAVSGDPFQSWAGPVSIAAGLEYRKDSVGGTSDELSQQNGWFTGNYKPTEGSVNVKEGFLETVVPLLSHNGSLDFNGAVRFTDYSLSGSVTTWKAGLSYSPVDALRFRAVQSRDIRAPNMGELFQAGATFRQDVRDPLNGNLLTSLTRVTAGNPDLDPEEADTTSLGIVYNPGWLSGLTLSVDYWAIDLSGAIGTLNNQDTLDRCLAGQTSLCDLIIRDPSTTLITHILGYPVNISQLKTSGIDYELSFRQEIGPGDLTIRALVSDTLDYYEVENGIKDDSLGEVARPEYRWMASVAYDVGPASAYVNAHGFPSLRINNSYVEGVDIDTNRAPGSSYVDVGASYRVIDNSDVRLTAYVKLDNALDKDPALIGGTGISSSSTNSILYDEIGRRWRVGVRVEF